MMGERTVMQEALFYSFRIEDHVPGDHLLRSIDRFVDLSGIREHLKGDVIVWSPQVLGLIGGELAMMAIAILVAGWVHARKPSFL